MSLRFAELLTVIFIILLAFVTSLLMMLHAVLSMISLRVRSIIVIAYCMVPSYYIIKKLQRVENSASRVVLCLKEFEQIAPVFV